MSPRVTIVRGRSPIVLVAPHGGRRDHVRRPWGSAPLKMNDLHTASLALDLAARLDASALVNDTTDRNDVDLNRISATHDHAPHVLDHLAELVEATVAAHGRATVLTIHGWNVVQPAVDIGLGTDPTHDAMTGRGSGTIGERFARGPLRGLTTGLARRGIVPTPGLRYPARARENLLQLFSDRHRDDARPLVRRLTALAPRVDALQLELALPVRFPGPWRTRFVDALIEAFLGPSASSAPSWALHGTTAPAPMAFEFVAPTMAGMVADDAHACRVLLILEDGRFLVLIAERIGSIPGHDRHDEGSRVHLSYRGPMLSFPNPTPFEDLERGLADASLIEAILELTFERALHVHDTPIPCPVGTVHARVVVDGVGYGLRVPGFAATKPRGGGALRATLRFGADTVLALGERDGIVCDGFHHRPLMRFEAILAPDERTVLVSYTPVNGSEVRTRATVGHRVPVVRPGLRTLLATCHSDGDNLGWIELPSECSKPKV